METIVKGHWSHSKEGERIWIPEHEMHVNEKVHKKHEHRLEEEIERLEKLEHEQKERVRA
jgi:hypothetical protein